MLAVVLELTAFSTNLVGRFRTSDVWKKRFAPHPRTQPQTGRKKARVCENFNTLRRGPPPEFILRGCGGAAPGQSGELKLQFSSIVNIGQHKSKNKIPNGSPGAQPPVQTANSNYIYHQHLTLGNIDKNSGPGARPPAETVNSNNSSPQ